MSIELITIFTYNLIKHSFSLLGGVIIEEKTKNDTKERIQETVRKAKQGDQEAIQFLINQYKPFIIKQCSKYKIPSYDTEDLIQYSYLSVLKAIKLYNFGNTHFTTYVMTAISNNLGYLLRKNIKLYKELQEEEGFNMDYADNTFGVEDIVIDKEDKERVKAAVKFLPENDQKLLKDFYEEDMPILAIAEEQGYSYSGIRKKRKRILKKLEKILEK